VTISPTRLNIIAWLQPAVQALLDLLFPPRCVACGQAGAWLCSACLARVPTLRPPLCAHCGLSQARIGLCSKCQDTSSYLETIRSVAPHLWPLRPAVHALKYEGLRAVAAPLAELLAQCWLAEGSPADVIVPVPLHPRRVRQRGYNQSALLAQALGLRLGVPVRCQVLARQRDTRSQVGLSAWERRDNVWGAFVCGDNGLSGMRILLVDDVFTTGATLEACAHALRAAGAARVHALTLTRALDPADDSGQADERDSPASPRKHDQSRIRGALNGRLP
jgi:ComF family protein